MIIRRGTSSLLALISLSVALLHAEERRSLIRQIPDPIASRAVRALGRYPGATRLNITIGLPLGDTEGLTAFIDALYNPSSATYKSYLTPDQFTARFGASAADYQKVVDFLKSSGLTVTATTPNRMIVDVAGSVSDFERVFRFTMRTYQHPSEARQFHAPDVEPSVPLDVPILDIMGLDDYMPPRRMDVKSSLLTKAQPNITGSGPNGGFLAKDLRTAYTPGVTLTGAGQSIGLFELGPYSPGDISSYLQTNGITNTVVVTNVLLNGVNGDWTSAYNDGEEALDIEMALAIAPAAQILVYEGTSPGDVMNRMATDNSARQLSCSWGFTPAPSTLQQILMEYAAQGQSFLHSSGDGGTWTTAVNPPGGSPYTTEVGGTVLMTNGPGGAWLSESAWSGSGGGFDSTFPIPSWQASVDMTLNLGSKTFRNFPDVSIVGAPTIFNVNNGHNGTGGGTSASAPLWAAFVALANQQGAAAQKPPVGFLNPIVYALGQGSRYNLDFHDITTGNNTNDNSPNLYYSVPGFDLTTGWGTPFGQNMINDLSSGGTAPAGFSLSVAPYQINVNQAGANQSNNGTASLTITSFGGFSSLVNLSVSGLPSGATASFSPASTVSTSTVTITVPSSVPAGMYVATLVATSGSMKQTIAVTLNVIAPIAPDFAITASPSVLSVLPGGSVTSTITIIPQGAFVAAASLSAPGAPLGIVVAFSPSNTTTTSTMTLSATINATPGLYAIPISASTGGSAHVVTLGLLVRTSASSPLPVDLSTAYNVTGISIDGSPFLTGMGDCCAFSANLLGPSLTVNQSIPFLFGPATNGIAPPLNAIGEGSKAMTVTLPTGQFGSFQMLATGKGGNEEAQQYQVNYTDGTSATFTQSISDWTNPQNYPGETTALTMPYSNQNTGDKVAPAVNLYAYAFTLSGCRTVSSIVLPQNGGLDTLALTLVPASPPCNVTNIATVNVVSGGTTISENTWIEIHGLNLAPPTVPSGGVTWSNAPEFAQGKMPTTLDGVSVTVNGNPAFVYYVSPTQIDVLVALGTAVGTVPLVVSNGAAVSAPFTVTKAAISPTFALSGGTKYLAATHANGTYIGPTSEGTLFTPVVPGEEVVLYGFGFGLPSGTPLVAGSATQSGTLPSMPTIQIGGQSAQVVFAGVISPGLYQFNVIVPANIPAGDNAVTAVYNQVPIASNGYLPVQGSN